MTNAHSPETLPIEDLRQYLDEAEALFDSDDPYAQQRGFANAARLYGELSRHTNDPTWAMAATMAGQMYGVLASWTRFEHRIPTVLPKTEAQNLHFGRCEYCGRPWQGYLEGACEHCPQLLFGATPSSREQARQINDAHPVDLAELHAPIEHDDY